MRDGLDHQALGRRKDTLFERAAALLVAPGPLPLAQHSLSPLVHRRWSSLPNALTDGTLDAAAVQRLVLAFLPARQDRSPPVWVIDGATWPRPTAGPGWSPSAGGSGGWRGRSSPTSACPGNGRSLRRG